MSLLGGITGADEAKHSGKQAAKGQKKAEATRREQLDKSNQLYTEQKAANAASEAKATGALTNAGQQQQNALAQASNQQQGVLQQDMARQQGIYQPGLDYAQGGYGLMQGGFGENPQSSADFMQRFQNSPLYQAAYQPALQEGLLAEQRMGAANGGLQSGGLLKALQDRASTIGGKFIGDYYGLLQNRLNYGAGLMGQASNAYQGNALGRASAYGNTGQLQSSAYGNTGNQLAGAYGDSASRGIQSGQLYSNNMNNAYGGIGDAQIGYGQAKAAGTMGAANSTANFTNGLVKAGGNALGSYLGA
jgi:hypothetical protein